MNQPSAIYLVFKLMDRGFTIESIDAVMTKLVGSDWRVITAANWITKFQEQGHMAREVSHLSVDDLETIIANSLKNSGP